MTAYDAGTAFLQIVPSFRGVDGLISSEVAKWNRQIKQGIADALPAGFREGGRAAAPEGAKAGEQFGGAFAQAVRRRIEAGLKALPKVEINANSTDTDIKIAAIRAQLEELRDKRIGIDIDEGLALAQLAALQGELDRLSHDDPSIAVRLDAAAASAELAAIQAEVNHLDGETAHVHVRVDQEGGFGLPGLGGLAGSLLPTGLGLASTAAVPIGAGAIGLGAGVTSALGAGAAGLGVLGLGLSGVQKAVEAVTAANKEAGASGTASGVAQVRAAMAVASAERQVSSAQAGLAQARANAADAAIAAQERVQSALQAQAAAERALTSAQQQQQAAQQALTEARKAAQQQIEDLTQAVADGQLSQRQADLDVTKARQHLQEVNADPLASQTDRQQAQLDYDTAVQRQKDLATQQQRTVDAQKAAVAAGVDGAASVVQAQQGVVSANQAVADAYLGIQNAAQAVADAQRAQAAQARQSAYAIQQAVNGVANAQAALQAAQLQTATAAGGAAATVAAMSVPLKNFATFIDGTLRPAFDKLRTAVQDVLLPDLQAGLSALLPALPSLTTFAVGLATTMGDLFVKASKALTSPFWQQFFQFLGRTAAPVLDTMAHIIGNIITGLAGLLQAFWPVSKGIGDGILNLTQKFADFATHLGSNSAFQSFLAYVKREGPAVAHFFGGVATLFGHLIEGLAPLGALMLDLLNQVLDLTNALGPAGLLLVIGTVGAAVAAFGGPVTAIVVAVTAFVGAIAYAYDHVKPFHDFIQQHLIPVLERIWKHVLAGVQDAFHRVADAVARNRPQLQDIYDKFKKFMTFVVDNVLPILGPVLRVAFNQIGASISALIDILGFLDITFNAVVLPGIKGFVKLALQSLGTFIHGAASAFGWIPGIGPKLKNAAKEFDNFAASVNEALSGIKAVTVAVIPGYANPQNLSIGHQYAEGGAVLGVGGWTSDSIPALLSNGEHVWPAREVAALGGQQAMYQLRRVLTGYATGGPVSRPNLGSVLPGMRAPAMANLDNLGGTRGDLYYEQHLHYPVPDSVGHGQLRAQQLLLHDLSNR